MDNVNFEDVTDDQAARLLAFINDAEKLTSNGTALAIGMMVARHTLLLGECHVSHREFERRFGVCRRTIGKAINRIKDTGLIERVGTSETGVAIYRANLDGAYAEVA